MNGSIKLGSILGITIRVHVLLLIGIGIFVAGSGTAEHTAIELGMLFSIILLHELAHSVVAMRFGLKVVDITLWPLGGMARMTQMPESSRVEGLVAIAGPALNFVLAGIGLPIWLWLATSDTVSSFTQQLAFYFLWWNLTLGGFNLLPAFPMDGGRILRAFLGRSGDWVRATETAVTIGRVIALMLGILAVLLYPVLGFQSVLFLLVAGFVWWAGAQELLAVRLRHGFDPMATIREFAARASGWSQTRSTTEPASAAPSEMGADPPPLWQAARSSGPDSGFTADEIARLEQFRGPLSSFGPEKS